MIKNITKLLVLSTALIATSSSLAQNPPPGYRFIDPLQGLRQPGVVYRDPWAHLYNPPTQRQIPPQIPPNPNPAYNQWYGRQWSNSFNRMERSTDTRYSINQRNYIIQQENLARQRFEIENQRWQEQIQSYNRAVENRQQTIERPPITNSRPPINNFRGNKGIEYYWPSGRPR
ncbi:MAG: hypothetical protein WC867_01960 [Candidatus Pacearchaeota archaeon]|jgi:hypothetical protein